MDEYTKALKFAIDCFKEKTLGITSGIADAASKPVMYINGNSNNDGLSTNASAATIPAAEISAYEELQTEQGYALCEDFDATCDNENTIPIFDASTNEQEITQQCECPVETETNIVSEDNEAVPSLTASDSESQQFYAKAHLKQNGVKSRRWSVAFGIIAIICSVSIGLGIVFGLLAIVLNLISGLITRKGCTKEQKCALRKHGKAGLVLGIVAISLSVAWFALLTVFFIFFADFSQVINNIYPDYDKIEYLGDTVQYIQEVIDSIIKYWNIR